MPKDLQTIGGTSGRPFVAKSDFEKNAFKVSLCEGEILPEGARGKFEGFPDEKALRA
jgi:hypothetical protein